MEAYIFIPANPGYEARTNVDGYDWAPVIAWRLYPDGSLPVPITTWGVADDPEFGFELKGPDGYADEVPH